MVDNELEGPVLGVAWDGTGYGGDGTVWGGEFLRVDDRGYRRVAHFLPFPLPGSEAAVREPRRAALGALYAMFGASALEMTDLAPIAAFRTVERGVLTAMLRSGLNAPFTSSAGRLFDAAAALLDLSQIASFEGEAAMAVEFAADRATTFVSLRAPVLSEDGDKLVVDWRPLFTALVEERAKGAFVGSLAAALHDGLAKAIVAVAERAGVSSILLTGGCFQNARLTDCAVNRLRDAGFTPYWHHRIPPNDGGLAVGQLAFAARPLIQEAS
jgi:hydrogenase maturation protein HypF